MVNKIIPGGAADKDGRLKVKDKIVGVGQGEEGDIVDVVDMKLSDVVKLIRGKPGHRGPPGGHSGRRHRSGRSTTSPARRSS